MSETAGKLIHAGRILEKGEGSTYVFLRQLNDHHYIWFIEEADGKERDASIFAPTIEEALRLAHRLWREKSFRTIHCGFRYTLPERDEHGYNAFFYQMAASYASSSGVYFDDEWGYNSIVHFASQEALNLWRKLQQEARL